MTRGADLGKAELTVALDVRNPLAYLALGPTLELGRELGTRIDWLPFAGQPLRRPSIPRPGDDRGVRHRRHRARMVAREIAVYADAQGLTIEEPYREAPADALNQAWLWIRGQAPEQLGAFLREAFRRYWALELDASDLDAAAEVVRACGHDGPRFLAWAQAEGQEVPERVGAELAEAGLVGAPAYLVGDEVFWGRQHLPMIRWLLGGRQGPGPI